MAQTTGGMTAVAVDVEYSSNGSAWTSLSGSTTSIEGVEQERISGEAYTFDGDTAIIGKGKRAPIEVTINFIYTEAAGEAFEVIRAAFEADGGTDLYFRWSPKGIGASGRFVFTTVDGTGAAAAVPITNFMYHELSAEEGAPVVGSWTFRAPAIAKTTTANSTALGS
jgi:hypothetical protein